MPPINWLAVIAATVASFAVGAIWYSPVLFTKVWQRESGVTDERAKSSNMPLIFTGALALTFLATVTFAMFLGPNPGMQLGVGAGFAAGLCWVAAAFGINYLFERRSLKLFLINGGYNVAMFTVMGTVLAALS
jgi:uncharacterized protein DUF1761